MAIKRYEPCKKVMECYPSWTKCGRPAPVETERCELHPLKKIWP